MSRALIAALLVAGVTSACKGKSAPKTETKAPPVDDPHAGLSIGSAAPPVEVNWVACDEVLAIAAGAIADARARLVVDGCRVCGDWTPILDWNTPSTDGGPKRIEIENAMARCKAYCNGDAKQKFLGTLDDARGKTARTPWRLLGQICTTEVSAVPDGRFMSATYFALDRIARAAAAHGGESAKRLHAIELPLPPLTVVGTGFALPELSVDNVSHGPKGDRYMQAPIGGVQITLLGDSIYIGHLPKARLGASGIAVDYGGDAYPGKQVSRDALAGELAKLTGGSKEPIIVLAPKATLAALLVPVIAAAAPIAPVYLGAVTRPGPTTVAAHVAIGSGANAEADEWLIPVAIPIALDADTNGAIRVTPQMKVQDLAAELAKRANQDVDRVGVTAR